MIDSGELKVQGDRSLILSREMSKDKSRLKSFLQSLNDMSNEQHANNRMPRQPNRISQYDDARFAVNDVHQQKRTGTPGGSQGSFGNESFGLQRQFEIGHDQNYDNEPGQAHGMSNEQLEIEEQFKSFRALRDKSGAMQQSKDSLNRKDLQNLHYPWIFKKR